MTNKDSSPRLVDTSGLAEALEAFARERDWGQFHSPKNLVMALTGEVGELAEVFQWLTEEQSRQVPEDSQRLARASEELADVLFYLVRLAAVLGVDLNDAAQAKLALNAEKYPPAQARGSSRKYNEN
jgi:dCTP diphosphatase